MTHLTERHLDIMKAAVQETADRLGIEISQTNVFLPERIDDLDSVDRLTFRTLVNDTQKWIVGRVGFWIYRDDPTDEEIVKKCRDCVTLAFLEKGIDKEAEIVERWIDEYEEKFGTEQEINFNIGIAHLRGWVDLRGKEKKDREK